MSKNILTIEISDQEIKVLGLSWKPWVKKIAQKAMLNFDSIPIPAGVIVEGILRDKEVFMGLIHNYVADKKLVGPIVINFLIPSQLGFVRTYRLPWITKAERTSAIGFLIDEEVPIPGSDLLSDYIVLEENRKNNTIHVLVGAARKSSIYAYVDVFQQVDFRVNNIDFAISALGYALVLEDNEESLYLRVEGSSFQFILFNGIIPEIVRTFSSDSIAIMPDVEWKKEIQRVLLYYGNQNSGLSLKKIYIDGEGVTESIAGWLSESGLVSRIQKADLVRIPDSWKIIC